MASPSQTGGQGIVDAVGICFFLFFLYFFGVFFFSVTSLTDERPAGSDRRWQENEVKKKRSVFTGNGRRPEVNQPRRCGEADECDILEMLFSTVWRRRGPSWPASGRFRWGDVTSVRERRWADFFFIFFFF